MCTAHQDIFVPASGIETDDGHKSFGEVAAGIAAAVDALLADPARASGVCGAIANPATIERIEAARGLGRIVRESAPLAEGRSATPLIVAVGAAATPLTKRNVSDRSRSSSPSAMPTRASRGPPIWRGAKARSPRRSTRIALCAPWTRSRGRRWTSRSSLISDIFVNQSAAFSDYHVTGANPAGNASLTDAAFVGSRFARVMWRRPKAA